MKYIKEFKIFEHTQNNIHDLIDCIGKDDVNTLNKFLNEGENDYDFILIKSIKKGSINILKLLVDKKLVDLNLLKRFLGYSAEHQSWDIFDYIISKIKICDDFQNIFTWIGSSSKIDNNQKKEILNKLQTYVDSGKCKLSQIVYKHGGGRISLDDIIEKYGSIKDYIIDTYLT